MAELRAPSRRRADRKISLILGAFVIGLPASASAGDIDRALEYAEGALGDQVIPDYAGSYQRSEDTMIPVFIARNMRKGAPPDSYQCDNTLIDGEWTLRTSTEDRWSHRRCREEMWRRDSLPGYQTLGSVRLNERIVEPWVRRASARTNVPEKLLHLMIRYQSGHRPGVISDEGNVGLLQLRPAFLSAMGIEATRRELLDPEQNIMLGAMYMKALVVHFKSFKHGLAAFIQGPEVIEDTPGGVPKDPKTIWFVREMFGLYYGQVRPFPHELAAENIAFVMTWLE